MVPPNQPKIVQVGIWMDELRVMFSCFRSGKKLCSGYQEDHVIIFSVAKYIAIGCHMA
jgi:hypothetical protein